MSRMGRCCRVALLSVLAAPPLLLAQSTEKELEHTESVQGRDAPPASAEQSSSKSGEAAPSAYAAALDGTGLISLDTRASGHLLLGLTASGGWDSNPDNLPGGAASGLYTVNPYLGMQVVTPRVRALAQYQLTRTGFSSTYASQMMNIGSTTVLMNVNDRWSWEMKAMGSYGRDSIRFLGSQQTVAVGEVPGTGPNSASYLPDAGTVAYVDTSVGVNFRKSDRDTLEFRASNAFSHYTGLASSNGVASVTAGYDRDLSPSLGILAYGQNSSYYGALGCESFGVGLGVRWKPSERTAIALSGGPQLDTASCGSQQGFAYSGSLSARLSAKSQIYLLSARQPTTSYLGPGLWQESASAGYQRQVTTIGTVGVDVGYVASGTLTTVSGYHGTYFDAVYGYRLGHGVRASYEYRGYLGDSGGVGFSRHVAQFSLTWSPGAGHVFQ